MESNWRWNVEILGLSEPRYWFDTSPPFLRLNLEYIAELRTPFVFAGVTYSYIAATYLGTGGRFWNYLGMFPGGYLSSRFAWQTGGKGFPYGAAVLPD